MSCKQPIYILLSVAALIFIYFMIMMFIYKDEKIFITKDPLNYKLFNLNMFENCCSGWPVSHFILFMILGFLYPNCWKIILLLGIIWELIEVSFYWFRSSDRQWVRTNNNLEYSKNWWAGSYKDIIFNCAGFGVGFLLAKLVKNNK
jgi:hypothetical protein